MLRPTTQPELHGAVRPEHRGESHRSLPGRGQRGVLWPDDLEADQHVRPAGAVRAFLFAPAICILTQDAASTSARTPAAQPSSSPPVSLVSRCWLQVVLTQEIIGHGALTGNFQEVSCSQWSGSDGGSEFSGSCLTGESAALWPSGTGCGNKGKRLALYHKQLLTLRARRLCPVMISGIFCIKVFALCRLYRAMCCWHCHRTFPRGE
jgi:hypothetical protein